MPSHSLMELGDGYVTMERLRNHGDGNHRMAILSIERESDKHGRHARVDGVPIDRGCPAGLQYPPDSDCPDRQLTTDLRGAQWWITNPGSILFDQRFDSESNGSGLPSQIRGGRTRSG